MSKTAIEYEAADRILIEMLGDAGICRNATYKPCEVQRILSIADSTFRGLCDRWEPGNPDKRGLESFRLNNHRRVTHRALIEWLIRNNHYERACG